MGELVYFSLMWVILCFVVILVCGDGFELVMEWVMVIEGLLFNWIIEVI